MNPTLQALKIIEAWHADQEGHFQAAHQVNLVAFRNIAGIAESPIRLVQLTPGLLRLLEITSGAQFALYARQGRHTDDRHPGDMQPAIRRFRAARLTHVGLPGTDDLERQWRSIALHTPEGKGVFIALKFVSAASSGSGQDECWVPTFHRRTDAIRRMVRQGKLRPLSADEQVHAGAIRPESL